MTRYSSRRHIITSILVLGAGAFIAWMDTRPGWDDAAISAGAVMLVAALGAAAGLRIWTSALLSALPVVALEVAGGLGVLLAVPFALGGSLAGSLIHESLVKEKGPPKP